MATPTTNKWRASTIYGNLSVRDLTNSAGTSVVEVASTDLSGNFLSRGDSTFTKKVICNCNVADINANNILTTKQYVDSAVSGGSILSSNNTFTGTNIFNNNVDISGNLDISGNVDVSGNFLSRGDSTFTKAVVCNALLADINANNKLTTKEYVDSVGGSSILGLNNTFTGDNIFTGDNTFNSGTVFNDVVLFFTGVSQDGATRGVHLNKFIRTDFEEQATMYSITDVRDSNFKSSLRVAQGDYPYLPTNSPYTTPQVFTIAAQQTIAGSQLTINQTTTTATNTADYTIPTTIISSFTIPTNFSKYITLNIPISLRNAGTWTLSGSALNATITNTINSMTATIYVNGVSAATVLITALNSNVLTRSTTIAFTTSGTKTIALDQYFFNIDLEMDTFFIDYIERDYSISNVVQIVLSMNITNTITRNSHIGNFTATNTLTLVSNTGVSTISNTSTTPNTTTYSPNANGTNYAAATSTSVYFDPTITTGGTTYTNHLRANTFNLLPEGMIIQYTGSTAPTGWLLCDGTAYNASSNKQYQALFNVIGITFGGGNNTNFQVPDYRGMFLRGAGTNGKTGYTTYTGQTLNTAQTDAIIAHTHDTNTPISTRRGVASDSANFVMSSNNVGSSNTQNWDGTTTSQSPTATETRPVSYSVNYLIKY